MILNRSKSAEIIFTNRWRRQQVDEPPPLTDITRVSSIKILGVTISNRLSLSQHVQNVVMSGIFGILSKVDLSSFTKCS